MKSILFSLNFKLLFVVFSMLPGFQESNAQTHLYGLTAIGGTDGFGAVFHFTPSTNNQIVDYSFPDSTSGWYPMYSQLTDGGNGKLYGMTWAGGSSNQGVIFEWDPDVNEYTKKIDFNGSNNGGLPVGSLIYNGGKFYGMTSRGGASGVGVIFEWDPVTNIYTKRIDFDGENGYYPNGSLTFNDGKFFGMTELGGVNFMGVIFEWDPVSNVCVKKIEFNGNDNGSSPRGNLTLSDGKFYGMTPYGGEVNFGIIFEWDPVTNICIKKIDFDYQNGANPYGSLTLRNGKIYGMTSYGGNNSRGIIFEWDRSTNSFISQISFGEANNGSYPYGSLTVKEDKIYGMTSSGGLNTSGVIFEWEPVTNIYTKKIDFNSLEMGNFPLGSLALKGEKFYGTTTAGGLNGVGVIFEWDPTTNNYTKKMDFSFTDNNGYSPSGSLILKEGKFYGLTQSGGTNELGTIFEWDPYTNLYIKKIDFNGNDKGRTPFGVSLTLCGSKFYGITNDGGANDVGVLFEWDPLTNIYTKKIDFNGAGNGSLPCGSLVLCRDRLYGMTKAGGINDLGILFEWDPVSNILTKKIELDGTDKGSSPNGSLALYGSKLYGMTTQGGVSGSGIIFDFDPATNIFTKTFDFNGLNGSWPYFTYLVEYPVAAPIYKTVILNSIFPEGLYNGNGALCKAQDQDGDHFPGTIADQITVELHDGNDYTNIIHTTNNLNFSTTGLSILAVPANLNGSYYLTIKYRNCIEITTASPVSFAGATVTYNFDNASKVFGGKLRQMTDGYWVMYGGDINQDGFINATDLNLVNNVSNDFTVGYLPADVNGDGIIDANDMIIVDNNASKFVTKVTP
jgi:uncharacterized repeat protein (TIGR03803 family)